MTSFLLSVEVITCSESSECRMPCVVSIFLSDCLMELFFIVYLPVGYPILGDPAYGLYGEAQAQGGLDKGQIGASLDLQKNLTKKRPPHENSMCLHAAKLSLKHPVSGETMSWEAVTPF